MTALATPNLWLPGLPALCPKCGKRRFGRVRDWLRNPFGLLHPVNGIALGPSGRRRLGPTGGLKLVPPTGSCCCGGCICGSGSSTGAFHNTLLVTIASGNPGVLGACIPNQATGSCNDFPAGCPHMSSVKAVGVVAAVNGTYCLPYVETQSVGTPQVAVACIYRIVIKNFFDVAFTDGNCTCDTSDPCFTGAVNTAHVKDLTVAASVNLPTSGNPTGGVHVTASISDTSNPITTNVFKVFDNLPQCTSYPWDILNCGGSVTTPNRQTVPYTDVFVTDCDGTPYLGSATVSDTAC